MYEYGKKEPVDQALNDATAGQFGEEPSAVPQSHLDGQERENPGRKAARKMSRNMS